MTEYDCYMNRFSLIITDASWRYYVTTFAKETYLKKGMLFCIKVAGSQLQCETQPEIICNRLYRDDNGARTCS